MWTIYLLKSVWCSLLLLFLVKDLSHLLLDGFLLEGQSILVPDKLRGGLADSMSLHTWLEQTDDVGVVWILSKAESSAVVHKLGKFLGLVLAQFLDGDLLLLFLNVIILLLLGSAWKPLPRKWSFQEIEQDMANAFKIVSSRLLVSDVCVDGGVSCGTCQVFAISEGDVLAVRTLVALG